VPITTEVMSERRMYLPLAAVVTVAVVVGARLIHGRVARTIAAVVVAAVLGALTVRRNLEYGSEYTLWEGALRVNPANARAWNNLGTLFLADGQVDAAA